MNDWKQEIRLPSASEYVILSGLDWDTEYEVRVLAENQQGKSRPGTIYMKTSPEPTTIPGTPSPPLCPTIDGHCIIQGCSNPIRHPPSRATKIGLLRALAMRQRDFMGRRVSELLLASRRLI